MVILNTDNHLQWAAGSRESSAKSPPAAKTKYFTELDRNRAVTSLYQPNSDTKREPTKTQTKTFLSSSLLVLLKSLISDEVESEGIRFIYILLHFNDWIITETRQKQCPHTSGWAKMPFLGVMVLCEILNSLKIIALVRILLFKSCKVCRFILDALWASLFIDQVKFIHLANEA